MVSLGSVEPFDHLRDDGVLGLGFNPVMICKVMELLMLFYNLRGPDYYLLVHALTLFYYMDVSHLRPGYITTMGAIKQLSKGFFIQLLCGDSAQNIGNFVVGSL